LILVTGGAGVMGSRLVRRFCEEGKRVRVLALPNDPGLHRLEGLNCEIVYSDITDRASLAGVCDGVDCVFHLAAVIIAADPEVFERVNVGGTRNILQESINCGVKHFIFVSSISVTYPISTPYSISKTKCEEMITGQHALNWTIVRPTLVYDKNGGQEFVMFMNTLLRFPIAFLVGRGEAIKNPVFVGDLIVGFVKLPLNQNAYNKIYNFCGSEKISVYELAKLILQLRHRNLLIIPVPVWICKVIASTSKIFMTSPPLTWNGIVGLTQDANPNWSQAQNDLGYRPIGVRQGLQQIFSNGCNPNTNM
jgi:nucleoside-diphosphate-sugar epimerase